MTAEPWTWDELANPNVMPVFATPSRDSDWCDRLESAPVDVVVGKVLCVCAAAAIARAAIVRTDARDEATPELDLLDQWIDDPTDERFEKICSLIFGDEPAYLGPEGVGWCALRTAASTVGNHEAGWALGCAYLAAERAGLGPEEIRQAAEYGVLKRRRTEER